jgi:hypothetical protein
VAKAEENLVYYSEQFDNAAWNKSSVTVTANADISPDGNTTAERLVFIAGTPSGILIQQNYATTSGGNATYTFSIYLKSNTGSSQTVRLKNTHGGVLDNFSSDLTITTSWQRFTYTVTNGSSAGTGQIAGIINNASGGSADILAWGAQLELRSSATAYTATTTAQITNYIPALQTAASGVARFEHNPVTGESLGLEIEEQRTNLFTYSDDFANAAWTKLNSTITSNTVVAPDGTLTADKLVETTANDVHYVRVNSVAVSNSTAYTMTVYAKAGERTFIALQPFGDSRVAYFNLSNGTVGTISGSPTSTSITSVGNGWYRCSLTASTTTTAVTPYIYLVSADNTAVYTGDGFSGIYIWGAQLEAGSFATSYIPTVASQVTRSADVADITGTNFSSWYRVDEGTLYAEGMAQPSTSTTSGLNAATIANIDVDASQNGLPRLARNVGGQGRYAYYIPSGYQAHFTDLGSWTSSTSGKIAGAYKVNDFAASFNANAVQTDTSGVLLVGNRINIGRYGSDGYWNSTIKKIAYYPKRLTNAELVALTTV